MFPSVAHFSSAHDGGACCGSAEPGEEVQTLSVDPAERNGMGALSGFVMQP